MRQLSHNVPEPLRLVLEEIDMLRGKHWLHELMVWEFMHTRAKDDKLMAFVLKWFPVYSETYGWTTVQHSFTLSVWDQVMKVID